MIRINQNNSSVSIISLAILFFPYSIGVKDTMKVFPSFPYPSNSPLFGIIENSGSESGVKYALKGAETLYLFVNLNETLEVLFSGENIEIISSSSGSVTSK